ncbi:MAG: hypothetical protein ACKVRP_12700 [Bacteroidota bacterium]
MISMKGTTPMKHVHRIGAYFCLLATTIFVLNGCGTSYMVTPLPGKGDYSYDQLNYEFIEKHAVIDLKDGREISAKQIVVKADSLYWADRASSEHYAVAVNEVRRISRTNHLIGALKGLGFGVLGAAFVLATNTSVGVDDSGFGFVVVGTLVSPPLGLIVGAIVGHPYEYSFPIDSTDTTNK